MANESFIDLLVLVGLAQTLLQEGEEDRNDNDGFETFSKDDEEDLGGKNVDHGERFDGRGKFEEFGGGGRQSSLDREPFVLGQNKGISTRRAKASGHAAQKAIRRRTHGRSLDELLRAAHPCGFPRGGEQDRAKRVDAPAVPSRANHGTPRQPLLVPLGPSVGGAPWRSLTELDSA